jgi:hypothetical protein
MLGLWGPTTAYGGEFHKCHIAFTIPMTELLAAGERLNAANIKTQNFAGEETIEPSVIGWMPSAPALFPRPRRSLTRVYHSLERISGAQL